MDPKKEQTTEQPETPTTPTAADAGQTGQPPQFTQEQLDAIVRDRLDRATKKTKADILAELGIEDVETAKRTLTEAQKAREAQMSETEKAQARIAELEAQAEAAKVEAEAIKAKAAEALLKAAIVAKAGGFNDPMDAWSFIDRSKVETDEAGNYTGIDEALEALSEAKPYLLKADGGDPAPSGPGTPPRNKRKTIVEKMLEDQEKHRPATTEVMRPTISF